MSRLPVRALLALALTLLFLGPSSADEKRAGELAKVAKEKAAREALGNFEKGNADWKVRMEALVSLAKIGPAAVPALVEALKNSQPTTREFAAQALVLFADANTGPALERALADPKPGVRLYAIQALSMLGPLPRSKEHERILTDDPTVYGVRPMMAAALER